MGTLTDPVREKFFLRTKRWQRAVGCWTLNDPAVHRIWDIWTRHNLRCDLIVTTRPVEYAVALSERLERENVPIRYVTALEASELARKLAYMPDVLWVVFGGTSQPFLFGSRGLHMAPNGQTAVF